MEYNREPRKRPYNYNQLISDKGNSMEKEQFFFKNWHWNNKCPYLNNGCEHTLPTSHKSERKWVTPFILVSHCWGSKLLQTWGLRHTNLLFCSSGC